MYTGPGSESSIQPLPPESGCQADWPLALSTQSLCLSEQLVKKNAWHHAGDSRNQRILADTLWVIRKTEGVPRGFWIGNTFRGPVKREEFITGCQESYVQAPKMPRTEIQSH